MGNQQQRSMARLLTYSLPSALATTCLLSSSFAHASEGKTTTERHQPQFAILPANESPIEKKPATSVTEWMAQIKASLIQITDVRSESEAGKLRLLLETNTELRSLPTPTEKDNQLTVLIPNAVLALPEGAGFTQDNPVAGIKQVTVTEVAGEQVKVVLTGVDTVPRVEVSREAQNWVVSVTTGPLAPPLLQQNVQRMKKSLNLRSLQKRH